MDVKDDFIWADVECDNRDAFKPTREDSVSFGLNRYHSTATYLRCPRGSAICLADSRASELGAGKASREKSKRHGFESQKLLGR